MCAEDVAIEARHDEIFLCNRSARNNQVGTTDTQSIDRLPVGDERSCAEG